MAAHTPRAARFCLHRRLRLTLSNSEKIALSIWLWQDAVWTIFDGIPSTVSFRFFGESRIFP